MSDCIHVVAGVLHDSQGRVLIAQRLAGTHMAGRWEFPGGKLRPAEPRRDGLLRELREELGISVTRCSPLIRLRHSYPEKEILLDFWSVHQYDGEPSGLEGQELKWLYISDLAAVDILEADKPVIDALRLPDRYAITPTPAGDATPVWIRDPQLFMDRVRAAVDGGTRMIQLRVPGAGSADLQTLTTAAMLVAPEARILINGDPAVTIPIALETGAAGVHLPSRFLSQFSARQINDQLLVGASCHNLDELILAAKIGAHFAVLGPVQKTTTHPDTVPLGWDRFAGLVERAVMPVYAVGGVGPDNIEQARSLGAQGVAGIRAFF